MKEKFIIAELRGRLGNQLFIFAASYSLAQKLGAELYFNSRRIRRTEDNLLPLVIGSLYKEANLKILRQVGHNPHNPNAQIWIRLWYKIRRTIIAFIRRNTGLKPAIFEEISSMHYDSSVTKLDLSVYLKGFFQNKLYFEDYQNQIFDILSKKLQITRMDSNMKGPVISVSFRRGDYNSLDIALPLEYYENALIYMEKHITIGTLMLFGDDWDFVQLLVEKWRNNYSVVNGLTLGSDPIAQLRHMAKGDHVIISNSSFAWWGAWLGDRNRPDQHRIVIAPKGWIKGENSQMIPERWIQISTETCSGE